MNYDIFIHSKKLQSLVRIELYLINSPNINDIIELHIKTILNHYSKFQ